MGDLPPEYAERLITKITIVEERALAYYQNPCASTLEGVFLIDGQVRCCPALSSLLCNHPP